ncbi:MAG TPA: hypothetical protein VN326_21300 [Casimicrobiaceae bacterium]|jgi:hypothetical protein|nr:hypothetical protein [Casimicrobiaceae bacterium]
MKIRAVVLYAMDAKPPFAESRPLSIEEVDINRAFDLLNEGRAVRQVVVFH